MNESVDLTSASQVESKIHAALDDHLAPLSDGDRIWRLGQQFQREGYLRVSDIVPTWVKDEVTQEAKDLIDSHGNRIELSISETGNSPRRMHTVSQRLVAENGVVIPALYRAPALIKHLSGIAGDELVSCAWEAEQYLILSQSQAGDTHGWHWGDFPYTMIWVLEAPPIDFGGMLQCVPHTSWSKTTPRVNEHLVLNPIRTYYHASGDLYFLRSDTTLHRTVPLDRPATRIILNTCWSAKGDALPRTHETMEAMFEV